MFPFKMSRSYQRPENALKRANEFIDVGKPLRALEVLYEVIKRGKTRNNYSEKLLEPIMFKYLQLCVDLKKSHMAKEGLYQYRNIFQSVNVSSLETVVRFYLRLADDRTESARKESHQAVVDIDDLDNLATPEEILLSAVCGEDAQDRSDRTILTPWVKFLWESYRQCLDLLRTNSRVEKLYHDIAKQAFKFCEKYNRKTEFRKLCDNLRLHLLHIHKQQGSATAVNLNNPETQQMNLETRLEQLNYAIKMELWQEAYKAIEDISDLMSKSKKMPKPHVMASYYQKLALVFWKAGNQLFHAAALFKLFQLLRDQKKHITPEELSAKASEVLVATLAIPLPSAHPEFDRFIETEKSAVEKVERLAMLLSLPKPPTRASLIKDLVRYNVINNAPTQLQDLYQLMEVDFDPLGLCKRMQTFIDWLNEQGGDSLSQYVTALQSMTITRLIKQVSQVYQTITFQRLLELSVFITAFRLERILVDLVRHNDLQIRVDHREGCIHFGKDLSESQREDLPEGPTLQPLPSETVRCQLVHMSEALHKCVELIAPMAKTKTMAPLRTQSIHHYNQTKQRDHQKILQRQHIIEERKELLETQSLEREDQKRRAQEDQMRRQKEEEQERLRKEASKREKERQEEQMKQIHTKQIKDKLMQISKTSYGQKMIEKFDNEELMNLGAEEILQRQVEELEKERKEIQKKLKVQDKNVDYFERAKRLVEIPKLKRHIEVEKKKDMEFWVSQEEERVQKLVEEHALAKANSKRLARMSSDRQVFVDRLRSARRSDIEKKLSDFNARLEVERKTRLAERKEHRRRERHEAYIRQKAEEEQRRRDEEFKKNKEEELRLENERMQMEEEEQARRKLDMDKEEIKQRNEKRAGSDEKNVWQPNRTAWGLKEQEGLDTWRVKDHRSREPENEEKPYSKDVRKDARLDEPRGPRKDAPEDRQRYDDGPRSDNREEEFRRRAPSPRREGRRDEGRNEPRGNENWRGQDKEEYRGERGGPIRDQDDGRKAGYKGDRYREGARKDEDYRDDRDDFRRDRGSGPWRGDKDDGRFNDRDDNYGDREMRKGRDIPRSGDRDSNRRDNYRDDQRRRPPRDDFGRSNKDDSYRRDWDDDYRRNDRDGPRRTDEWRDGGRRGGGMGRSDFGGARGDDYRRPPERRTDDKRPPFRREDRDNRGMERDGPSNWRGSRDSRDSRDDGGSWRKPADSNRDDRYQKPEPRDRDRMDVRRGPPDDRSDFKRGGPEERRGGDNWRNDDDHPRDMRPSKGPSVNDSPREGRGRLQDEENGWTTVRR